MPPNTLPPRFCPKMQPKPTNKIYGSTFTSQRVSRNRKRIFWTVMSTHQCWTWVTSHWMNLWTQRYLFTMNIVYFDQSHQPGSHWIAVNITDSGSTEYVDSYGDTVQNILIDTKLKQMGRIKRSKHVLQGISTVCGQYCHIFVLMRARNYWYKNILSTLRQVDSSRERHFIVSQVTNDLFWKYL